MTAASDISGHYTSGDLLARLEASLREAGVDPARPTLEALAPCDHFHGPRGTRRAGRGSAYLGASGDDMEVDALLDLSRRLTERTASG